MTLVCARPHNLVTSESEWIPAIYWIRSGVVDTYQIYDGTDELGIVGTVAPGPFAQEGRCWRMVYENPVGHGTHCMELGVGRGVEVPRRLDEGGVTSSMLTS